MIDWSSINIGQVLFGLSRLFFMFVLLVVVVLGVRQDWDSLYRLKLKAVVFVRDTFVNICRSIHVLILLGLFGLSFYSLLGVEFSMLLMAGWVIYCACAGWKQKTNKEQYKMGDESK